MTDTIIKRVSGKDGILFYNTNGRNAKLSDCDVRIEICEHKTSVRSLGKNAGYKRKSYMLAVTFNNESTSEVNETLLKSIDSFELTADFQRKDGKYENFVFHNLELNCFIDLDNPEAEWEFIINGSSDLMERLMRL